MGRFDAFKSGKFKGSCWPDAVLLDEMGKPKQLFDFKFKCPGGTKSRKKKGGGWVRSSGNQPTPTWTQYKGGTTQKQKYERLGDALGIDNDTHPPEVISVPNEHCP